MRISDWSSDVCSSDLYEHWLLRALASIYGVDISADNVEESRVRLLEVLRSHYHNDANTMTPSEGFASAARTIVASNIVHADFLARSEESRVGKECVSTCRSRRSAYN